MMEDEKTHGNMIIHFHVLPYEIRDFESHKRHWKKYLPKHIYFVDFLFSKHHLCGFMFLRYLRYLLYSRPKRKIVAIENDSYSYIEMVEINVNQNDIFYALDMDLYTIYEDFEIENSIIIQKSCIKII